MIKLLDALEEACGYIEYELCGENENRQDMLDLCYAALRDSEADGWVSVKEPPQSPTPKPPRLGWMLTNGVDVWISHAHPSWWANKDQTSSNPNADATHWRPLPEPPKEEK